MSDKLAIITPSRGRPERLAAMAAAAIEHAKHPVELWVGLDNDDESNYEDAIDGAFKAGADVFVQRQPRRSLSSWSNWLTRRCLEAADPPAWLVSMGDDHLVRTPGWDMILSGAIDALDGPGFAYGNDLLQGSALPTAWMAHADAVRALRWLMLPSCDHMYVDNAILELGRAAGRLTYMPGAIIEHVHPNAGKVAMDESYRASNRLEQYRRDGAAFEAWRDGQMQRDADTLRALTYDHCDN